MSGRRSSFKNVTAKADLAVYLALLYRKPGGIFHDNLPHENEDLPLLPQTELTDNVSLFKMVTGALAAICVYKDRAQVFALTVGVLVDGSNSQDVFLHLAENTEVSESVIKHLHDIWRLLIDLRDSPDHSTAPISLAIYHHSFLKFRRRFKKRQYLFLKSILKPSFSIQLRGLQNAVDSPVKTEAVQRTFSAVCALHQQWKPYLDDPSPKSLFLEWDNVAEDANIQFSLRRYLGKLFTLHEHSLAICEIVFRKELAPLLGGTLVIVPIPPDKPNITLNLTEGHARALILDVASGLKEMDSHVVYEAVISKLISKTARNNLLCSPLHDISFKGTVHCESNLLAFHHQHRLPDTINFIACSKLSCPACQILFNARNAETLGTHIPFYTPGSHNTLYFDWAAPLLGDPAPIAPPLRLGYRPIPLTVDERVRRKIISGYLWPQLKSYVEYIRQELKGDGTTLTPPGSESTDESGRARRDS